MATPTYELIETHTSTTNTAFSFTNIPQDYRDLILVTSGGRSTKSLRLNNDSGFNYNFVYMDTLGSSPRSNSSSNSASLFFHFEAGLSIMQIMDYAETDKHKSILMRINDADSPRVLAEAARYASTNAVTSIDILSTFGDGLPVTFSLYGIAS